MTKKKPISVALQGGGAYGAFTWGVLDRLLEDPRISIEGLSGTSAGAMNALALVQGFVNNGHAGQARQNLENFWRKVSQYGVFNPMKSSLIDPITSHLHAAHHNLSYTMMNMMQSVLSPYYWNPYNVNPLKTLAEEFFDFESLRHHKEHKVFICATHVYSGKLKIFPNEKITLDTLLASSCLPFLFQAVHIDGEPYWDGGFVGNPVIYPLMNHCQTSDILVIQLTRQTCEKNPTTANEILERHKEISYNSCLMREMRAISFITKLIDSKVIQDPKMRRFNMHIIRQSEENSSSLRNALNTDMGFFETLFHQGREQADRWIDAHFPSIGKESTANIEEDFVDL